MQKTLWLVVSCCFLLGCGAENNAPVQCKDQFALWENGVTGERVITHSSSGVHEPDISIRYMEEHGELVHYVYSDFRGAVECESFAECLEKEIRDCEIKSATMARREVERRKRDASWKTIKEGGE